MLSDQAEPTYGFLRFFVTYLRLEAVKESEKEPNEQIKDVSLLEVDGEERDGKLHRGRETLVDQHLGLWPLVSHRGCQIF